MFLLQVVILSQVLACDATLGYEDLFNTQVLKFNETPVRNLRHLAQLTSACTQPFMRFDLEYNVRRLALSNCQNYLCYLPSRSSRSWRPCWLVQELCMGSCILLILVSLQFRDLLGAT